MNNEVISIFGDTIGVSYSIMVFIYAIITIVASWKLLSKAGKPGWAIFIPIYNIYVSYKIVYGNGWLFLLLLVPFVNIVVSIAFIIDQAKVYGKSLGFGICHLFFNGITILILAFGSSEYEGTVKMFNSAEPGMFD